MSRDTEQRDPAAALPDSEAYVRADRRDRFVDDPRKKKVMLAMVLSLMPGLGQVYVGYYDLAFRNILVVCGLIAIVATVHGDLGPVVGLFLTFFWLHNIVDAGRRASFYNQALAGIRPMELPEDVKAPQQAIGSLAGGVLLVAVGLMLFANTMFRIPLDWLASWWPLALVGAGAWLIYVDRRAKAAAGESPL
ncbi:MAG: DUF5668 domain-containing protein [Vicinamibacterales bacterium]